MFLRGYNINRTRYPLVNSLTHNRIVRIRPIAPRPVKIHKQIKTLDQELIRHVESNATERRATSHSPQERSESIFLIFFYYPS